MNKLSETYLTAAQIAAHVRRSVTTIHNDHKHGLITLRKRDGIKGRVATAHGVNKYISLKFFGKVPLLTEETLEAMSGLVRIDEAHGHENQ